MATINIPASKSLTISNYNTCNYSNKDIISVGKNKTTYYYSYLFFDTSSLISCISLLSAKLVLFKVTNFIDNDSIKFSIYPLMDYFSSFTTYKNPCRIDQTLKHDFMPFSKDIAIEIDITDIVAKWLDNTLNNKGLLIIENIDNNNISLSSFGSAYSKDNTLIPFINVSFLSLIPISGLKCNVSVIP